MTRKSFSLIAASLCALTVTSGVESQLFLRYWSNASVLGEPGTVNSLFRDVISLPNGQFLAVGRSVPTGNSTGLLAYYSRSGAIVRQIALNNGPGYLELLQVELTNTNEIVVLGKTTFPSQIFVWKANLAGETIWAHQGGPGGSTSEHASLKMKVHSDGSVYVAGTSQTGSTSNPFVMKLSTTGSLVGSVQYATPSTGFDLVNGLSVNSSGQAFVVGKSDQSAFLWKVNSGMTNAYSQLFQSLPGQMDSMDCILALGDGTAVGVGNAATNNRLYFVKWDAAGTRGAPVFDPTLGYGTYSNLHLDPTGNFIATGFCYNDSTSSEDVLVSKYSPTLTKLWSSKYNSASTRNERGIDSVVDAFGETYSISTSRVGFGSENDLVITKHSGVGGLRFAERFQPKPGGFAAMTAIALHKSSGDLMAVGEHPLSPETKSVGVIYRQAPLALIDGFVIKRNTVYVSPRTLTTNDRQWQGATVSLVSGVSSGTLVLRSNGTFTYTPAPGFTGITSFVYRLTKPGLTTSQATVTLQVVP